MLRETQRSLRLSGVEEEEVFGRVFKFGEHATLSDGPYEVRLVPLGTTTMPSGAARRMLVDPAADGGPDWGWFDAFRGGQ